MKLISWNVNGIRAVATKNAFAWVDEEKPEDFSGTLGVRATFSTFF